MTRRNKILLAASLVLLGGLVAWALQPRPVAVETAAVTRGAFEQAVSDDGKTRVRERYVVSAPLAGRIERIALEAGDAVKQGQVVALLSPAAPAFLDARTASELQERVGAAQAQLARARAETAKAQAQRDRADVSYNQKKNVNIPTKARITFNPEKQTRRKSPSLETYQKKIIKKFHVRVENLRFI